MGKRAIHYDDWDGGTEADTDPPDTLFCGTETSDAELSQYSDHVSCKRCLKILGATKARHEAEDIQQKADLYDEVWQKARDMGFMNVTMALARLAELTNKPSDAERERLMKVVERYPNGNPLEYNAAVRKLQQ